METGTAIKKTNVRTVKKSLVDNNKTAKDDKKVPNIRSKSIVVNNDVKPDAVPADQRSEASLKSHIKEQSKEKSKDKSKDKSKENTNLSNTVDTSIIKTKSK